MSTREEKEKKRIEFEPAHLHLHPIYGFLFSFCFLLNPHKRDTQKKEKTK